MRRYSNQPHYINFLGKLSQHLCIDMLRFEDFDSHFLTKICAFIPEELFKEREKKQSAETYIKSKIVFRQTTYRSPNDPDPTLFPIFNCLASISQTSVPSVGISTQLDNFSSVLSLCPPIA